MPYIEKKDRLTLDYSIESLAIRISTYDEIAGRFNYSISRMIDIILGQRGLNYANVNEIVGALECIKLELYRRIASPYEDKKIEENGDVYNENV
tara:strand:+ start:8168 stop:8449 length:282 start_codon:yes stop_codon:yes gene_type:complete